MRPISIAALIFATAIGLSACVSITPAPAGDYKAGASTVSLGRTWSDMSSAMFGRTKQVRLLSIDGPLLNRLYIVDGLPVGGRMIRSPSKERPSPAVRADMSPSERMEFVSDSVAAFDYLRVATERPRPAKLGGVDAIRFDLVAVTKDGLDIKGTAVVAETRNKLYLILYLAPAEHYFDATLNEVETIMQSVRIPA